MKYSLRDKNTKHCKFELTKEYLQKRKFEIKRVMLPDNNMFLAGLWNLGLRSAGFVKALFYFNIIWWDDDFKWPVL